MRDLIKVNFPTHMEQFTPHPRTAVFILDKKKHCQLEKSLGWRAFIGWPSMQLRVLNTSGSGESARPLLMGPGLSTFSRPKIIFMDKWGCQEWRALQNTRKDYGSRMRRQSDLRNLPVGLDPKLVDLLMVSYGLTRDKPK